MPITIQLCLLQGLHVVEIHLSTGNAPIGTGLRTVGTADQADRPVLPGQQFSRQQFADVPAAGNDDVIIFSHCGNSSIPYHGPIMP